LSNSPWWKSAASESEPFFARSRRKIAASPHCSARSWNGRPTLTNRTTAIWVVLSWCFAGLPSPSFCEEPEAPTEDETEAADETREAQPRHRFDFGSELTDASKADSFVGSLGYTWAVRSNMQLNATLRFAAINAQTREAADVQASGIGDTLISFSYVPGKKLNAQPWIPSSVGAGAALILPTGDAANGLGLDMYIISPFLVWTVKLAERFVLLPGLRYARSFNLGDLGRPVEGVSAEVGFVWVSKTQLWVGYYPQLVRALINDQWLLNHDLELGKVFRRFGVSVTRRVKDRLNLGGTDEVWSLNLHLTWGRTATGSG